MGNCCSEAERPKAAPNPGKKKVTLQLPEKEQRKEREVRGEELKEEFRRPAVGDKDVKEDDSNDNVATPSELADGDAEEVRRQFDANKLLDRRPWEALKVAYTHAMQESIAQSEELGRAGGDPLQHRIIAHAQVRRENYPCAKYIQEILSAAPQECYIPRADPPKNDAEEKALVRSLEGAVWDCLRVSDELPDKLKPDLKKLMESGVIPFPDDAKSTARGLAESAALEGSTEASPEGESSETTEDPVFLAQPSIASMPKCSLAHMSNNSIVPLERKSVPKIDVDYDAISCSSVIDLQMPEPPTPLPPTWCTTPLTAANLERNTELIGKEVPFAPLPEEGRGAVPEELFVFPAPADAQADVREDMVDDDANPLHVVQTIENTGEPDGRVVYFYNGNPNLQLIVELINAEIHPDAHTVYDEDLKRDVITLTVFPGEKRGACLQWKKKKFPKVKWRLETLGPDYLEWRKSERCAQVFEKLVALSKVAPQDAPEEEAFHKAIETGVPFVDAAFFPGDDALLACMNYSDFESEHKKRTAALPEELRADAEAAGLNMAVVATSGWARNYVIPQEEGGVVQKMLFHPDGVCSSEIRLTPHALGCRWLLCALAVLAEYRMAHPQAKGNTSDRSVDDKGGVLVRTAFALNNNDMLNAGGCKVLLCKDGWWGLSIIDDYLPMDHNVPAFASSTKGAHILWLSLLEKAFAKSCGSYMSLHGPGSVDETMCDVTGFPVKSYSGEAWEDHKAYMTELMAVWRGEFDYIVVLVSPPGEDDIVVGDCVITPGCGYYVEGVSEDFETVTISDPYSKPGDVSHHRVDWYQAARLFAGVSVCYVEPHSRELRTVLPVHPNGNMFAFGMFIELEEDAPKVRCLIHAHQEDARRNGDTETPNGVMMITVLGFYSQAEWVKLASVAEWGPRDMIAAQDDEDPDPGIVLDPEYHRKYFVAFHMHPQCPVRGDLVAAMHYTPEGDVPAGTKLGTVTFKENNGWDYANGNVSTRFDPVGMADVEATIQRRETYFDPIEAGVLSTVEL